MSVPKIPTRMRKLVCTSLGSGFRENTAIIEGDVPQPKRAEALLKTLLVCVNASDVLTTLGFHGDGTAVQTTLGLEAIGEVVSVGEGSKAKIGEYYTVSPRLGCFAEYLIVPQARLVSPLPSFDPAYISMDMCGTSAALAIDKKAKIKRGNKVLVTGAAGGTGQFAVQLAKQAGAHVIGTCSSQEKCDYLQKIGCDRPINYTKESVDDVLQREYPDGVDVVFECIGGKMFDTALKNLAVHGRLVCVGTLSEYSEGKPDDHREMGINISWTAIQKSAEICGFMLYHNMAEFEKYKTRLYNLYKMGRLQVCMDNGSNSARGPFNGLEGVYDALDYLFEKRNIGKIYVTL